MTDELIEQPVPETTEQPAETPAAPAAADLERTIAELREQVAESNRTAQFWAEQARGSAQSARTTPAQPEPDEPEPEPEDDDVLEAITTKGSKGFDALAVKRGFIKRSEVAEMIETRASSLSKEQELMGRYPDLKDRTSDFFKATAGHYGQLVKSGVNAQTAMELASEKAELDFMRAGKLGPAASRDRDRQARIDAQGGGGGGRRPAASETDDDTLTPDQKHIADMMGISHEAYLKRAKAGVRMGGRNR